MPRLRYLPLPCHTPLATRYTPLQNTILTHQQAPPSFQPNIPPSQSTSPSTSTSTTSNLQSLLSTSKRNEPDLITRYNLQSRIALEDKGKQREANSLNMGTGSGSTNGSGNGGATWRTTKESRQETLKRRRDEMILEARRKMMERDAQQTMGGVGQ